MPAIFPELQPEELLYSGIARLDDMMRFPSLKALWRYVYGECALRLDLHLCGSLDRLVSRMPSSFQQDPSSLLRNHTLFPYLTFSMSSSRRREIERVLSYGGARKPGGMIGTDSWKVKYPRYLKYCKSCASEDQSKIGVPYWRRSHQLPGVVVCPDHGKALFATGVSRPVADSPREIFSLEQVLKHGKTYRLDVPSRFIDSALDVARDSLWLLENSEPREEYLSGRHRDWLLAHGWQRGANKGRLSRAAFLQSLRTFYDEEFFLMLCEGRDSLVIPKSGGWAKRMVAKKKSKAVLHPLQHILLWRFLGLNARQFFEEPPDPAVAVGSGEIDNQIREGPCRNVVCDLFDLSVPHIDSEKKITVSCPICKYTYTSKEIGFENPGRIRVLRTGAIWDNKLKRLLEEKPRLALRKVAKEMGSSRYFIQKHALRIGIWRSDWSRSSLKRILPNKTESKKIRHRKLVKERRKKWLEIQEKFPEEMRSELVERGKGKYKWLRKNDYEWYDNNSPIKIKGFKIKEKNKWKKIDEETMHEAEGVVKSMRNEDPIVRITKGAVASRIGQSGTLQSRLRSELLPKTRAFLDQVCETQYDVHLRGLRRAVDYFAQQGKLPNRGDFRQSAGMDRNARVNYDLAESAYVSLKNKMKKRIKIPTRWEIKSQ